MVGSVTGFLAVFGVILAILLVKYGPKIHRLATTLLGTDQERVIQSEPWSHHQNKVEVSGRSSAMAYSLANAPRYRYQGNSTVSLAEAGSAGPEEEVPKTTHTIMGDLSNGGIVRE